MGRTSIQHAVSNITTIGAGTAPGKFGFVETTGARTLTGASQNITGNRGTDELCNTGDTIKYVNLFIQVGPREAGTGNDERIGWLEYAVTMVKESETNIPITQLGTQTLGEVATNMFRNECIWTGSIPVGNAQPAVMSLKIKVPKFKQTLRIGDEWILWTSYRDMNATGVSTDSIRLIKSAIYKGYV